MWWKLYNPSAQLNVDSFAVIVSELTVSPVRVLRPSQCLKLATSSFMSIPPWLIPPALRPDSKQGLGQPLQTQTRQGWSHSEPHVTGSSLTRSPCCPKNQFSFLQGAVQQTDLEKGWEGNINKDKEGGCLAGKSKMTRRTKWITKGIRESGRKEERRKIRSRWVKMRGTSLKTCKWSINHIEYRV